MEKEAKAVLARPRLSALLLRARLQVRAWFGFGFGFGFG